MAKERRKSPTTPQIKDRKATTRMRVDSVDRLTRLLTAGGGASPAGRGVGGLVAPSPDAVARYTAVPLLFDAPRGARARAGSVVLDSWSTTGGFALRDATAGHIRRLRLGSGDLHLDLVAERRREGWQFTARVRAGERVAHDFVLKADARKLLPASGGYYSWSSRRVPHRLELISFDTRVQFERVAWS